MKENPRNNYSKIHPSSWLSEGIWPPRGIVNSSNTQAEVTALLQVVQVLLLEFNRCDRLAEFLWQIRSVRSTGFKFCEFSY